MPVTQKEMEVIETYLAALVEEVVDARLIDEPLQELARRRLLCEIVLVQIDALLLEVGDRLPTARSTRFEIDVDVLLHRSRINMKCRACSRVRL